MPSVKIVTNKNGTIVRNLILPTGTCTYTVDQGATALESIICEDKDILHIEVDYEGCDDSNTVK